jgi:hypothetical protein
MWVRPSEATQYELIGWLWVAFPLVERSGSVFSTCYLFKLST